MPTTTAADETLAQLRARAVNDVTRAVAVNGLHLTHEQADDLGEETLAWCRRRLRLTMHDTHEGVDLVPARGADALKALDALKELP